MHDGNCLESDVKDPKNYDTDTKDSEKRITIATIEDFFNVEPQASINPKRES